MWIGRIRSVARAEQELGQKSIVETGFTKAQTDINKKTIAIKEKLWTSMMMILLIHTKTISKIMIMTIYFDENDDHVRNDSESSESPNFNLWKNTEQCCLTLA